MLLNDCLAHQAAARNVAAASSSEAMLPNGLRPILLIDDNHEDLFLTKRLLARAGIRHPIITIDDGEEAMAFLRAAAAPTSAGLLPCVVFCDIRMPKVDGFDLVKWARGEPGLARTVIVMLTGGDVPEDRTRAKALGADHFLVKFPTPDVLKAIVDRACEATP